MLEKKKYVSLDCIDGDTDACEEVIGNYSNDAYICDIITEVADNSVNIYNHQLWENAPKIREYIEEAIEEGLVDTSNVDLIRIFQAGEYQYYTQLLYENLETMIFNYAVNYINENYPDVNIEAEEVEQRLSNIDNNDTFDRIEEEINALIEELKENEEEKTL